jgi:hypothetical protein
MDGRVAGFVRGTSRWRAALWVVLAVGLFIAPIAYLELTTLTFGAAIGSGIVGLLLGTILAGIQAGTNGGVLLSWLLTAAPLVALEVTFNPPLTRAPALLLLVLFFGSTAHLAGAETARERDASPRAFDRRERLGLGAIVLLTGLVFAVAYVVPPWIS